MTAITTPKFIFEPKHGNILSTSIRGGERKKLQGTMEKIIDKWFGGNTYNYILLYIITCESFV